MPIDEIPKHIGLFIADEDTRKFAQLQLGVMKGIPTQVAVFEKLPEIIYALQHTGKRLHLLAIDREYMNPVFNIVLNVVGQAIPYVILVLKPDEQRPFDDKLFTQPEHLRKVRVVKMPGEDPLDTDQHATLKEVAFELFGVRQR